MFKSWRYFWWWLKCVRYFTVFTNYDWWYIFCFTFKFQCHVHFTLLYLSNYYWTQFCSSEMSCRRMCCMLLLFSSLSLLTVTSKSSPSNPHSDSASSIPVKTKICKSLNFDRKSAVHSIKVKLISLPGTNWKPLAFRVSSSAVMRTVKHASVCFS